jgi:hypothetical protein
MKSGASNMTFTHRMTPCGGAAARHLNLKPDRPVCLLTVCPVDRSVTPLDFLACALITTLLEPRARHFLHVRSIRTRCNPELVALWARRLIYFGIQFSHILILSFETVSLATTEEVSKIISNWALHQRILRQVANPLTVGSTSVTTAMFL